MGLEKDGDIPFDAGSFYSMGDDLLLKKQISPVSISNGLAWNPDNDIFYYIDSFTYQVVAYDYNCQTGTICKKFTMYLVYILCYVNQNLHFQISIL